MSQPDDDRRAAIEAWFGKRGITLRYSLVGEPGVLQEWLALRQPGNPLSGVEEGGGGTTKVAAAEDALANYIKLNPHEVEP